MKVNLQKYQIILVLAPKVDEAAKDKVFKKVESWLEDNQGKVVKKDSLGTKELVYEIAKFRKGDFWSLIVESEKPMKLASFNLLLNREANIIRYLILNNPAEINKTVAGK